MIWKLLVVVLLSTFEIYAAIGSGMYAGLSKEVILICVLVGGIAGVFASLYLGNYINKLIARFKKPKPIDPNAKPNFKERLLLNLKSKYGLFGVGFIGTFLVGGPISMGVGLTLGITPKSVLKWCLLAIILRSFFWVYALELLVDVVKKLF
jgi:hypothetical protein